MRDLDTDFTLGNCLFGSAKLTKNADPDKYKCSGYGVEFYSSSAFLLPDGSFGKNVIIFGPDMNSSVHVNNKGKDVLILGKVAIQRLDGTTVTVEAKYHINFSKSNERFV